MTFCNSHGSGVWVAISFWDDEVCEGEKGGWRNRGWWRVEPGACVQVHSGIVSNVGRYWYFYAEADDGAVWTGDYPTYVMDPEAFDICDGIGSTAYWTRGFREIDTGDVHNFTATLT